ncbi:MAG: succinyl-diaminopimelate desuccinylase [Methyloceanibacter sp.]
MTDLNESPVELARGLIRCPSITPTDAGALELLERALAEGGFQCRRLTFRDDGTLPVDNLFARIGSGMPHLCFAGHTDVVPPGDEGLWTYPPFGGVIEDGVLYGRGASDMKGAIAAFAAAALDFARSKGDDIPGSISLLITGDEEGPGINGTRKVLDWMAANGEQPDHALVGEPTNATRLGEAIKIGRRGSLNGRLLVTGVQGHVAYPHLAKNPLKGLVAVLARLYDAPLDFGSAYFSPSNFEVTSIDVGNATTNVIPVKAEAMFNIRYNDRHSAESLKTKVWEVAAKILEPSGLEFELAFEPPSPTFLTEPGQLDSILTQAVREITGVTPSLSTDGGTSDARFIKELCPVVEFGLLTKTIHKIDEHVSLADLEQLTAVYRRFLDLYFEEFGIFELV